VIQSFFSFDRMLTPRLISAMNAIGIVLAILSGVIMIIAGINQPYGGGATVVGGLLWILVGPLVVRLYCELVIVLFKINENLQTMRENSSAQ